MYVTAETYLINFYGIAAPPKGKHFRDVIDFPILDVNGHSSDAIRCPRVSRRNPSLT